MQSPPSSQQEEKVRQALQIGTGLAAGSTTGSWQVSAALPFVSRLLGWATGRSPLEQPLLLTP